MVVLANQITMVTASTRTRLLFILLVLIISIKHFFFIVKMDIYKLETLMEKYVCNVIVPFLAV